MYSTVLALLTLAGSSLAQDTILVTVTTMPAPAATYAVPTTTRTPGISYPPGYAQAEQSNYVTVVQAREKAEELQWVYKALLTAGLVSGLTLLLASLIYYLVAIRPLRKEHARLLAYHVASPNREPFDDEKVSLKHHKPAELGYSPRDRPPTYDGTRKYAPGGFGAAALAAAVSAPVARALTFDSTRAAGTSYMATVTPSWVVMGTASASAPRRTDMSAVIAAKNVVRLWEDKIALAAGLGAVLMALGLASVGLCVLWYVKRGRQMRREVREMRARMGAMDEGQVVASKLKTSTIAQ